MANEFDADTQLFVPLISQLNIGATYRQRFTLHCFLRHLPDMAELGTDIQTQRLLLAASNHDLVTLRSLLQSGSANVEDPDTGYTPLHAAIAAFDSEDDVTSKKLNGYSEVVTTPVDKLDEPHAMEAATETLKLLLRNGAIWNDLDRNNETPGCIAHRLRLMKLYEIMVDAGVRAELLLNRLDEYQKLEEESEDSTEGDGNGQPAAAISRMDPTLSDTDGDSKDTTRFKPEASLTDVKNEDYLQGEITLKGDRILDADNNAVMMAWEKDIMKRTVELLAPTKCSRVLNVGHGMGIIDEYFQGYSPASHHIIEAHPSVMDDLKRKGWQEIPGVVVHEGRWQDTLPKLIEQNMTFDIIYFDTFAEDYSAFRDFFNEHVIGLLDSGAVNSEGRWSFFHGLGADRQICYDVYTKVRKTPYLRA